MINDYYSLENISLAFDELDNGKLNPGIARLSRNSFKKNKNFHFNVIHNKVLNQTYRFSPYKEVLLIKNKSSIPRIISIPTIRDKIMLNILKNIIEDNYKGKLPENKVDIIISQISQIIKTGKYNYYFKIDLKNYYGKINHELLINKLKKNIKSVEALHLINSAIKNITVDTELPKKDRDCKTNKVGVPQGLSISNILANIYLNEFDIKYSHDVNYAYFRYVDDIIVLCKKSEFKKIRSAMEKDLTNRVEYDLEINTKKRIDGYIKNSIDFLGYSILQNADINIQRKNILRMEKSIENIFNQYKNSKDKRIKGNTELLKWKLDLHITGCIKGERQYGWVKFFRLSDCDEVFYKLDYVVRSIINRYKLEKVLLIHNKYIGKKFAKTYYEIKKNIKNTTYIPNFNNYDVKMKKHVLNTICNRNTTKMNDSAIEFEFDRFIFRSISDLDQDLQQIYL